MPRFDYFYAMPLTAANFDGFDAASGGRYLNSFDSRTKKKGEQYFRLGTVQSLVCFDPGNRYLAEVRGGALYCVELICDEKGWTSKCSCPLDSNCKHAYAAFKQVLIEHTNASVQTLSATAGKISSISKPVGPPATFGEMVKSKLDRKLTREESTYLNNVNHLFRQCLSGGLFYVSALEVLGLRSSGGYWQRLEMYPTVPRTEQEFWNYLALYIKEKLKSTIPDFLESFTDLDEAREKMQKHQRGLDIERWNQTLSRLDEPAAERAEVTEANSQVELRLRFDSKGACFEWRETDGEWKEIKARKHQSFDTAHASQLSPEATLLWQPFFNKSLVAYSTSLKYTDEWMMTQTARWLRQTNLRPLLAGDDGEPLVFHDAPLRWQVGQPEEKDGDYSFSLKHPNGEPLPEVWFVTATKPVLYLTPLGVFNGPPFEPQLMSLDKPTLIPAKAFESAGGLRLADRLQVEPPPRLAERVQTIKLLPCIVAEVRKPYAGSEAEYCFVDVMGASDDGQFVERLNNNGWMATETSESRFEPPKNVLRRMDRSALGVLFPTLQDAGFKWEYGAQRWTLKLTKKFAEILVPFLKAQPPGTRIELRGELASFQNAEVAGKIRLEASEDGMDWFNLQVIVDVNDVTLTKAEIKLLLDAKGKWVRLDQKGWRKLEFTLSKEEDEELARLGLTPHELTSEPQRLHALQLADKASRKFLPAETCDRIERRVTEIQARVTPDLPVEIRATLRPYQLEGFHFLAYLSTNHFGGILADDMGLGKTVQTLAWLAWLRGGAAAGKMPAAKLPSLVVCPKSVADNWRAEAEHFYPMLKVRVWGASDLKSFPGMLDTADLHVLNYSQLRVVGEDLVREKFHVVILDEGQYIKNPSSQTALVARSLRTEHRLILSGTPIENRLLDLWSLMSFAMPGALGSRAEFGRMYDAKGDPFARQRLSARVRPFLIRRTKAQVARDLPDRMEEDLFCELEGEQKTLYRAELKRAQAMLLGVKTAAALNKQRFNFLTSLLRLRQICCHPRLVKPDSKAASAKVEALVETLEPLMEEGEKVLVFSQFVGLLDILRDEIKERGWKQWHLAGDTENRGDLVREFQAAEGAGVFLISLKAGGFGLNLTASSYVVLFDPWWNPAVENQAIDRTHRIGQARKVIAYRLLIKDSIEEKIRALQKQKSSLANDVLGEEKFAQGLSLDDLQYLLAG